MILSEFESIMREHMDYSDRKTIKAICEAGSNEQNQMLTALTSKLYEKIVAKADKINYNTIAKSKGDITKIDKFADLEECLDLVRKIVIQYKQSTGPVDVVCTAIENCKSKRPLLQKAFAVKSPIPMMLYNNVALAIANSTSFMIATCIEYVKSPTAETFDMALNTVAYNKTMDHTLFKSLVQFNEGCKNNDFDESLKLCISKRIVTESATEIDVKPDTPFFTPDEIEAGEEIVHDDDIVDEAVLGSILSNTARAFVLILKCFIPIIRITVYYFYSFKQNVYDYCTVQADMLEMNAYQLQYNNNIDEERRKKVYDKQMKIAAKFRKIANKFSIDNAVATKNANNMVQQDQRQYNSDELANEYVENGDSDIF